MTEQEKQSLNTYLARCLTLELVDDYHCVEVRADRLAELWAESGSVGRTFGLELARKHSKWVLKNDKKLKERYLGAKTTLAAKTN